MEWEDVKDPTGTFVLRGGWHASLMNFYTPDGVQGWISEAGMMQTLRKINGEALVLIGHRLLKPVYISRRKTIIAAESWCFRKSSTGSP